MPTIIRRYIRRPRSVGDILRLFYQYVGAPYPKISLIVIAVLCALVGGFIWHALGQSYQIKSFETVAQRAADLSREMLQFLDDRSRSAPPIRFGENFESSTGDMLRHSSETRIQFSSKFGSRLRAIVSDLERVNVTDSRLVSYAESGAVNPLVMREIAERLGALAERLEIGNNVN